MPSKSNKKKKSGKNKSKDKNKSTPKKKDPSALEKDVADDAKSISTKSTASTTRASIDDPTKALDAKLKAVRDLDARYQRERQEKEEKEKELAIIRSKIQDLSAKKEMKEKELTDVESKVTDSLGETVTKENDLAKTPNDEVANNLVESQEDEQKDLSGADSKVDHASVKRDVENGLPPKDSVCEDIEASDGNDSNKNEETEIFRGVILKLKSELTSTKNQLEVWKTQSEKAKSTLATVWKEYKTLGNAFEAKEAEIEKLKVKYYEVNARVQAKETDDGGENDAILTQERDELQNKLRQKEVELCALEQVVANSQEELSLARETSLKDSSAAGVALIKVAERLDAKTQELATSDAKCSELDAKCRDLANALQNREVEMKSKLVEIEKVNDRLLATEAQLMKAKEEADDAKVNFEKVMKDLAKDLEEKDEELNEKEIEYNALAEKYKMLEEKTATKDNELEEAMTTIANKDKHIVDLNEELTLSQSAAKEAKLALEALSQHLEVKNNELAEMRSELQSLEEKYQSQQRQLSDLMSEMESMKQQSRKVETSDTRSLDPGSSDILRNEGDAAKRNLSILCGMGLSVAALAIGQRRLSSK
eukprot:CAMPEP_0172479700 /NCGR_PEP_ID=MMETSP1066-20121228/4468_1 /TAXON_ID=671091 /ORGANISM="Coscinodiscus wailesii, Strain CCMP2513" /LENGTH=595 /DNA_ID=CAMNT_0013240399 /DNA_START=82 /DNA_END=1869 /DNA_ORIENTATION=+